MMFQKDPNHSEVTNYLVLHQTSHHEDSLVRVFNSYSLSDINRGVIMKSPDGQCWRGTLDNTGQLSFVAINIDEAIVTLYGIEDFPSSNGGQFGDNAIRVQLVSDSWIEETTSWNTQPGIINGPEVVVPMNNDYDSINIDIAPLLNYIITNELSFNGIRLSQVNETNPFRVMVFHSSNSDSLNLTPRISINYQDSFNPESCNEPDIQLEIENGDIYLSDISRGVIMKSPDGQCWRGTLDNTGQLSFVVITCP